MNEPSEQIDSRLNVLIAPDQPLSPRCVDNAVLSALNQTDLGHSGLGQVNIDSIGDRIRVARFVYHESPELGKHAFLTAAVTFLGGHGNHPVFKKRIQLKDWFKLAFKKLQSEGYTVHFLGVYHYNKNVILVDFDPDTYKKRKMHNSSAFVYVNDLFRAMKDGVAQRVDLHGNVITTVRRDKIVDWLTRKEASERSDTFELVEVFRNFNQVFPYNEWLYGQNVIPLMHNAGWSQWRQTEWPGWFLEFKFSSYLLDKKISSVVYQGLSAKKDGDLDFDLLFPFHKFYGDLKSSDMGYDVSPGNDKKNVLDALARYDRFWYIIFEHETIKDSACGGELCKFRYDYLCAVDGKAKSPTSYLSRMKNRINYKRMMILELNRANCGEILSEFAQGHQPNMGKRAAKFKISKSNVENFQVYHYVAS